MAGVTIFLIAMLFSVVGTRNASTKGGAVVIIGPFPIIFGSDKRSARVLLILSIVLVALLIVLYLVQAHI